MTSNDYFYILIISAGQLGHNYFSNDFKRRKAWSLIISISPATVDISNKLESVNK